HFLEYLADGFDSDVILATHTGLKWHRALNHNRHFINVGVLGRPENDGRTNVWYALVSASPPAESAGCGDGIEPAYLPTLSDRGRSLLTVDFIPVSYDHERLAHEMRAEHLPDEFCTTVLTGWWTTCLEMLPAKERRRGPY